MRLNLWLAQPETERKLATALRVALAVFACWALAAAYGLWSTGAALAASQASLVSQSKKITDVSHGIPHKRAEAAKAAGVEVAVPESAASADLADELSRIAQATGAEIAGVRMGDDGQGTRATSSGAGAAAAAPAPTSTPVSDGWDQETFECNVAGEYGALTRFLNVLAASRHVLEITEVDVTQAGGKTQADAPRLEMKMNGIVYELPEKP